MTLAEKVRIRTYVASLHLERLARHAPWQLFGRLSLGALVIGLGLWAFVYSGRAEAATPVVTGSGTASITWQAPTESEDGLALAAGDIKGYVLFWGPDSRFAGTVANPLALRAGCTRKPIARASQECYPGVKDLTASGPSLSTTVTIPLTADASLNFAVTAVNTRNEWSDYSNELRKMVRLTVTSTAPPRAPVATSVTVGVTCTTDSPTATCTFRVE